MKRYLLLVIVVFFLTACISGKTEHFPSKAYSIDVAEVTVIRKSGLFGFGFALKVVLDEQVIARLKAGQYVTFYTTPGVHSIGIPDSTISVPFQRGQKHFVLIKTTSDQYGWEVERIDNKKGLALMAKSTSIE